MRKLIPLAILAGAVLASPAGAEDYYRSGYWTNSVMTANDGKATLCIMRTVFPNSGKYVFLKYNNDSDTFFIQLAKTTWRIPEGQKIAIEVGFDKEAWGGMTDAYGYKGTPSGGIFVNINPKAVSSFFEAVASADTMWFKFGGSEPAWTVKMDGSRNSVTSFKACVAKFSARGATQPFSSGPKNDDGRDQDDSSPQSSQPFDSKDPMPTKREIPRNGKDREA